MSDLTDLAVRAARAEIERDAALDRAKQAEAALLAVTGKDVEAMLDTIRIMGITARDFRDIWLAYQWHRERTL